MSSDNTKSVHIPVLPAEVLAQLCVRPEGRYIDGTLGGASHSELILRSLGPEGRLLGIDRDVDALERARRKLAAYSDNLELAHGSFDEMKALANNHGMDRVDGILLDLGTSSDQLDTAERGFSFMKDGPLDMRMDTTRGVTAADWVNQTPEGDMVSVFRELGEEPQARRVAAAIARARENAPITRTLALAELVESTIGRPPRHRGRRSRIHPATKVFQAIRMVVNRELDALRDGLESALDLLVPGGRLAVISFHSLEDRMVKQFGVAHVGRDVSLPLGGSEWQGELPRVRWVAKRGWTASEEEVAANPRARSARLRVMERLEDIEVEKDGQNG